MAGTLVSLRPLWEADDRFVRRGVPSLLDEGTWLVHSPAQRLVLEPGTAALDPAFFSDDNKPRWLAATSPASAQALQQHPMLCRTLLAQSSRLRWAAVGEGSSQALREVLRALGLESPVVCPDGPGDANALIERLSFEGSGEIALLESTDNRAVLSQGLEQAGWRVRRWALYRREPLLPIRLVDLERPLWMLLSSSGQVRVALDAMAGQGLAPDEARWLVHHPTIEAALRGACPSAPILRLASPNEADAATAIKLAS
ncbi:MAG: uroporphyrinogen-III synthase [Burkholderiaceae bacterium]